MKWTDENVHKLLNSAVKAAFDKGYKTAMHEAESAVCEVKWRENMERAGIKEWWRILEFEQEHIDV